MGHPKVLLKICLTRSLVGAAGWLTATRGFACAVATTVTVFVEQFAKQTAEMTPTARIAAGCFASATWLFGGCSTGWLAAIICGRTASRLAAIICWRSASGFAAIVTTATMFMKQFAEQTAEMTPTARIAAGRFTSATWLFGWRSTSGLAAIVGCAALWLATTCRLRASTVVMPSEM